MWINTAMLIGISEANKNLYSALAIADSAGCAVVLKQNAPAYVIFAKSDYIDTEKMAKAGIRDVKYNFSALTNLVYRAGSVCITKRGKPAYVVYDYVVVAKNIALSSLVFNVGYEKGKM